jgi:hypothetical protein
VAWLACALLAAGAMLPHALNNQGAEVATNAAIAADRRDLAGAGFSGTERGAITLKAMANAERHAGGVLARTRGHAAKIAAAARCRLTQTGIAESRDDGIDVGAL